MKTSSYNAWWREMGAISRGMMFIEGSIATPDALDSVDRPERADAPSARPAPSPESKRKAFSLYEDLLFLGGRPMTAGHNDDIDESFPQIRDTGSQPGSHRLGARQRNRASQSPACATC